MREVSRLREKERYEVYDDEEAATMSFGKMNIMIDLIRTATVKDVEGFGSTGDTVLASVRAYREGRHGSQRWANLAAFSEATDLFRFRCIPGVAVSTRLVIACADGRFDVISVENVKGRGMYVEVLARKAEAADGKG